MQKILILYMTDNIVKIPTISGAQISSLIVVAFYADFVFNKSHKMA